MLVAGPAGPRCRAPPTPLPSRARERKLNKTGRFAARGGGMSERSTSTRTARVPRVYVRAADSIGDYKPIPSRLLIREPFDYDAEGLPSPARSYLDALESPDSKRNMGYALDIFAAFLSAGRVEREQIPWHTL